MYPSTIMTLNISPETKIGKLTGWNAEEIAQHVQALIVTRGGDGSTIYSSDGVAEIPTASASSIVDPTGCGDAYRAGLLYGLMHDLGWEVTGRIASLCGAIKIENAGTQNHTFTRETFATRYAESFGKALIW